MDLLVCTAVQPDRAVIVVTHDTRVFHFADTIAHMDDGRIVRTESRRHGQSFANNGSHEIGTSAATHRHQFQLAEPIRR
jgi:ABC-type transport system involved in cytochrome bd biosynthesis fused ATPase/permease subunit